MYIFVVSQPSFWNIAGFYCSLKVVDICSLLFLQPTHLHSIFFGHVTSLCYWCQVASLAISTANGLLLKGGKEAYHSNKCFHSLVEEALSMYVPPETISLVSLLRVRPTSNVNA